ncbi:MAG: putative rRNA methylase [Parachlamydiales bacterium]|nr:putative rRNA methylase [Parachlamydiales bacterium]
MERYSPHLSLAHAYWKNHLRPGDTAIDATCGNGHDMLVLAQILLEDPSSLLIGLDIQSAALANTSSLLERSIPASHMARVLLQRHSHADLAQIPLPNPVRLIVYNLGYLPGADKKITTQTETTLSSLKIAASLLAQDGALSITCYPGHEEGAREETAILDWAKQLAPNRWQICHHCWINRKASPTFFWIRSIDETHESSSMKDGKERKVF